MFWWRHGWFRPMNVNSCMIDAIINTCISGNQFPYIAKHTAGYHSQKPSFCMHGDKHEITWKYDISWL
jgi:hypothetical protein